LIRLEARIATVRPLISAIGGSNLKHMTIGESDWFYTRRIGPGIWMIAEPQHVYSYLIEGSDRAILIDTGLGIAPIRPVAESLTDRPISVVNTHYHFDHIGGNTEFDDISIHEAGAPLIEIPNPPETYTGYIEYAEGQLAAGRAVIPHDREYLWLLGPESEPRPFPDGFDPGAWTIEPSVATTTLKDGDGVGLGDRSLEVIHLPGHSPDGISLLEEETGFIFVGDCVGPGPIYAQFEDSDFDDLTRSARRLADLGDSVRVAVFGHYGRPVAEPDLFPGIADGLEQLASGKVTPMRSTDIFGTPVLEKRFDHFNVLWADPEAGAGR
jgi:glyoxylase-like metal-dependent hydrolase (beta-lactamase superfamily II)